MRRNSLLATAIMLATLGGVLAVAGCVTVNTGAKTTPASSTTPASKAATSTPKSAFAPGQPVAAVWSDGNLYLAEVTAVDGANVTVKYADDSSTKTVAAADVRPIPSKTWAVGDKVKAVWSSGRFYDGVITKVGGASYEVKWDDGSAPSQVASTKIIAR